MNKEEITAMSWLIATSGADVCTACVNCTACAKDDPDYVYDAKRCCAGVVEYFKRNGKPAPAVHRVPRTGRPRRSKLKE